MIPTLHTRLRDLPHAFWRILLISLVLKLIASWLLPLTSDEAYYWVWSHHMQLSFFDHPPVVAWLFWLTHPLENFGGAARWAGVLLGHATLLIWLILLRPLLSNEQLRLWLWLALLSPLIGAGSILVTPDIPLLFFWVLTLLLFVQWLEAPTNIHSLALGVSCGLGLCSKYVMVLEPMFLFLACLAYPSWRKTLVKSWPWVFLGVVGGSLPVWLWNLRHDMASFRFQAEHGLGHDYWKPNWTYEYILGQIGLIFPTVFIWAIRGSKRAPIWLSILAWGPLGFFLLTSSKGYVEANWPIVAYAEIFALVAIWLGQSTAAFRATLIVWAVALTAMVVLITTRWSPTGEPIKTKEFFQFEPLKPVAAAHDPIFARSYQMAAKLSFDLKKPVLKLKDMNRRDFYDFLAESAPPGNFFYLLAEKADILPAIYLQQGWKITSKSPINGSDEFDLWEVRR